MNLPAIDLEIQGFLLSSAIHHFSIYRTQGLPLWKQKNKWFATKVHLQLAHWLCTQGSQVQSTLLNGTSSPFLTARPALIITSSIRSLKRQCRKQLASGEWFSISGKRRRNVRHVWGFEPHVFIIRRQECASCKKWERCSFEFCDCNLKTFF